MLKRYIYKGKEWLYEEGEQPAGATELKPKAITPANKAKKPANKTRRAAKK